MISRGATVEATGGLTAGCDTSCDVPAVDQDRGRTVAPGVNREVRVTRVELVPDGRKAGLAKRCAQARAGPLPVRATVEGDELDHGHRPYIPIPEPDPIPWPEFIMFPITT